MTFTTVLARGGFAEVTLAMSAQTGQLIAIKRMKQVYRQSELPSHNCLYGPSFL